jgi:hypothetical protein
MRRRFFIPAIFVLVLLCVVGLHHEFLSYGFQADDLAFSSPTRSIYFTRVEALHEWINIWNPNRGWLYRPVFLTYWAGLNVVGLAQPVPMHALGLALHAAIIAMWGLLVYRLTCRAPLAILAGASFLLWPNYSEAVSWIAAHSVLIAVALVFSSFHAFVSWRETGRPLFYVGSVIFFLLGCCAKNDVALAGLVFPALDLFSVERVRARRYLPYLLATIAFVALEKTASISFAQQDPNYAFKFDLMQRFNCVLQFVNLNFQGALPLFPIGPSLLFLVPLVFAVMVVTGKNDGRFLKLLSVFSVAALVPLPLAAGVFVLYGAIGEGNRFLYFSSIPVSLLVTWLVGLSLRSIWENRHRLAAPETISGLVIATLFLASMLRFPSLIQFGVEPGFEFLGLLVFLAAGYVTYRCQALDTRLIAGMSIVLCIRAAASYLAMDIHPDWFMVIAGIATGLAWRREFLFGALFALIFWQQPVLVMAAIVGLRCCTIPLKVRERQLSRVAIEL